MKIHIYYRYFWPDTPPYAQMLKVMSAWMVEAGHSVFVVTAQPAYKPEANIPLQPMHETLDGVEVRRVGLMVERTRGLVRLLNGGIFTIRAAFDVVFGARPDVVWTATMPPVIQAFLLRLASKCRGANFVYHMQDIYPEIAEVGGTTRWFFRPMRWLDNWTLRHADAVVVLSQDMKNTIMARTNNACKIHVINNFALETAGTQRKRQAAAPCRFLFAGNIGRHQNLEKLVDTFARINANTASLTFMGEGAAKAALQEKVRLLGLTNVSFQPHASVQQAFVAMQNADVGIVSLNPGLFRLAFPSKLLTYLAAELHILALVESESELSRMVEGSGLGLCCAPDADAEAVAEAVERVAAYLAEKGVTELAGLELYQPAARRKDWISLMQSLQLKAERETQ